MCGLVMRTRRIPSVLSLSNSVGTPQRSLHTLSAIFSTPIEPLFSDKTRDLLRNVYQKGYIDELNNLTPGFFSFSFSFFPLLSLIYF